MGFFGCLIALWALLAERRIWDPTLFPSPLDVAHTLVERVRDGTLLDAVAISLRRVLVGYAVSLLIGVPLGIVLARQRLLGDTVGALVSGLQSLPSICWLPLALLWFGLNDRAILFVVVMGAFVSITVTVEDGVRNLPPTFVRAAKTLGVRGPRLYTQVLLPASMPSILTGAKLGWSYAWRALMSGELLFVSLGLGRMLMMGRELEDMSQVIAVMIVIVGIGLFADGVIFGALEKAMRERWGFAAA